MWVLKSQLRCPPGSFPYEQTEGISKKFEASPLLEEQAHRVADFRKGNGLPRATVAEALQDIDCYTCARLGNNRRFCYDTDRTYAEVSPMANRASGGGGCHGCGAVIA